jgi:hypothetical protein
VSNEIEQSILDLRQAGYDIEEMGDVNDYMGINFEGLKWGKINLSQSHLIDAILKDVGLTLNEYTRKTPSRVAIIRRDGKGVPFNESFHYQAVVGKLFF